MARRISTPNEVLGGALLSVADALGDGIWSIDREGCVTYANDALARILRVPREKIIGRSAFDFVFDQDQELAHKLLELRKTNQLQNFDFRLRAIDGAPVWTHCRSASILDDDGQFAGALAVVKRVIAPLEEAASESLAAAIVDSSDDAIVTKSLDGIIRTWNKGAEKVFGYTAREAVGKPVLMLLPKDRYPEETEILSMIRSGKLIDHYETVRVRKDGREIDVSVTISPLFDANGAIVGATKVARDITEQKRKAELRSHLASIIESSDDAIVSKTREGIIETWNKGAEKIFGYTAEEAIGKPILLIVPADRKYEEADILARICHGERVDHFETVRVRKDGALIDVSVTVSPIVNADGKVIGASKVARDISEQKRAHDHLHLALEKLVGERTAQLEKANKELEGFTYSVSHDLRAPLRSIVSSCMILEEDFGEKLPAEAKEELKKQSKAAKRMADLIDDLLKLSRLGRQELKKTHLDITALAREVSSEIQHGGSQCDFHIADGLHAYGDTPTIKLALVNLMENACKFSGHKGVVEVGQEHGVFFVKDHGIGFDQQYEQKMFLPFERLVLDREYPGTGIGLANVKRIIERHGGQIWAQSPGLGQGATFFFKLPAN